MSGVLNVAEDIAKGASAGSVVPGIGTAIGALGGLAMGIYPGIGQFLFGRNAPAVQKAVGDIATRITGTSDPAAQAAALQNAQAQAQMRVALAQLAAEQTEAGWQDHLSEIEARLADTQNARSQQIELTKASSPVQWAPVAISVVILIAFGVMLYLVFSKALPAGSQSLGDILVGTLGGMATQVGNFWLGSSSDSRVKTHLLAAVRPK